MAIESHKKKKKKKTIHHQIHITSEMGSQPLPNLPHEIIADILSRLPVKSLMKFRSVCKSWLSLISDPQFVETHLSLASKTDDYYTHHRFIFNSIFEIDLESYSLYSFLNGQPDDAVELKYPWKRIHDWVYIVGACNGLVCIFVEGLALFLWNPSTRKSNRLPDSGPGKTSGRFPMYGFGYDKSNDDYKIVMIVRQRGSGNSFGAEVQVYSLWTNSWRRIGDFYHDIPVYDSGKFVNGSLHWAARAPSGSSYSRVIVSLDLATEMYEEVVQPNYGDGNFEFTLCVLNEFLCVFCEFLGRHADVWIMKEYGMGESWTKMFTIPNRLDLRRSHKSKALRISKNGEILLLSDSTLSLYNPKDSTFRDFSIPNMHSFRQIYAYVESLVAPNVDNVI